MQIDYIAHDMTEQLQNQNPKPRCHLRWMIRCDMPEVLRIEQDSFEHAWTDEDFLNCLRQRNAIGMVAEHGDKIIGFMIYELHKSKIHILNFAVDPEFRRQRVGAQMVAKLIGKLSSHGRTELTASVRESNLSAQVFFRKAFGKDNMPPTKVLRNYYEDSGEDAYHMRYSIAHEPLQPGNRITSYLDALEEQRGNNDVERGLG